MNQRTSLSPHPDTHALVARAVRGASLHSTPQGLAELLSALHDACAADDYAFRDVIKALDRFPQAVARVALLSEPVGERAVCCVTGSPIDQNDDDCRDSPEVRARSVRSVRNFAMQSVAALRAFFTENRLSESACALAVRIDSVADGPVFGDVEVRSFSPQAGWFVWDRIAFTGESLAGVALALYGVAHGITCEIRAKPANFIPGPLFDFHPERFKDSRRYARRARQFHSSGGLPTFDTIKAVMNLVVLEMNDRFGEFTRREKLARPTHATVRMEAEEVLAMAWLKYVGAGKQIFHIPTHMSEMLRATDADDIPVAMIRLPYGSLFLHFGSQADLEVDPQWFIDGCYVEYHPDVPLLSFTFTAQPRDPARMAEWHSFGEPVVVLHLAKEAFSHNLATAVDHAVAERMKSLREELAQGDEDITAPDGVRVKRVSGSRAANQIALVEQRRHTMHDALQLAVNALCYLTAYPDDIKEEWPDGTPITLRRAAEEGSPNQRKRASQELTRIGFTRIKVCGGALRQALPPQAGSPAHGHGSVCTHWRRGHWRRQVHGEGRALRKLIWLMPTLVNPGSQEADEVIGHIYTVE